MAKVNFIKHPGGVLIPATDVDAESMTRHKNGVMYEIDIKEGRNQAFHGKVFLFFGFCFEHWANDNDIQDEKEQREQFRKDMTIMAGYYDVVTNIRGDKRKVAQSLSYNSMTQERFEGVYSALITVALREIFKTMDSSTENRLLSFF